jgi:hypothetical protein
VNKNFCELVDNQHRLLLTNDNSTTTGMETPWQLSNRRKSRGSAIVTMSAGARRRHLRISASRGVRRNAGERRS